MNDEHYEKLVSMNLESDIGFYFPIKMENLFCRERKEEFIKQNEGKFILMCAELFV